MQNIPTTMIVKSKPFLTAFLCNCSGKLENPMHGTSAWQQEHINYQSEQLHPPQHHRQLDNSNYFKMQQTKNNKLINLNT